MARLFRFKVQLQGIKPPIWRRFLLPTTASFAELHEAIQDSCGWQDCHLFTFLEAGGRRQEIPGSTTPAGESDWAATPLASWFRERGKTGRKCLYWYDFGDDWMHEVSLEAVEEHGEGGRKLLAGARAFPPEDCGGIPGYGRCVAVLRAGKDPELLEWLGNWDPERFELELEKGRFEGRSSLRSTAEKTGAGPDPGEQILFSPLPGMPPEAVRSRPASLPRHLFRIVTAASAHPPGEVFTTGLACIRRPARRPCPGRITVKRSDSGEEIEWRCSVCNDGGLATGWAGSQFDLSDEAAVYARSEKTEISVRIPADVYGALLDEENTAISPGRLLYSAEASAGQVILRGVPEELEALLEEITSDLDAALLGARQERLEVAREALRDGLASDEDTGSDEEQEIFTEATEGLPLTQEEEDALWKMFRDSWPLFAGSPGAAEEMGSMLRELGGRFVLDRKIREGLAVELVDRDQVPFFLGHLRCLQERIEEFGTPFPECGFELCRSFLAGIGGIAERVRVEENELARFAVQVTQDALEMAANLEESSDALRVLLGDLLGLWTGDRCGAFFFAPDLIVALKLDQRDRKWLRGLIEMRRDEPGAREVEELEEFRGRLE